MKNIDYKEFGEIFNDLYLNFFEKVKDKDSVSAVNTCIYYQKNLIKDFVYYGTLTSSQLADIYLKKDDGRN